MDKLPVVPDPEVDSTFKLTLEYTYKMYQGVLETGCSSNASVVPTSAPGFPYSAVGIANKGDAVESQLHKELIEILATPVALSNSKDEALPEEDLLDGKLRTVMCSPAYLVVITKYFFESQNTLQKDNHQFLWGKYGYVKQYGGFNRLFAEMEPFEVLWEGDASGWDRSISLLWTYELRVRGILAHFNVKYSSKYALQAVFSSPEEDILFEESHRKVKNILNLKLFRFAIYEAIFPVVATVDGVVYRRMTGNNSGGADTTTDNTIAHVIIAMHLFIRLFFKTFFRYPTYHEVMTFTRHFLFGDDVLGGFKNIFDMSSLEYQESIIQHYLLYGLTLKPKAFKILMKSPLQPFSGLSFLGSTAYWKNGYYVPFPRVGKFCYSLSSRAGNAEDTDDITVAKLVALWDIISVCFNNGDHPEMEDLKVAVSKYATYIAKVIAPRDVSRLLTDQLLFATTSTINLSLYLGIESRSAVNFLSGPVVGGIKRPSMDTIPLGNSNRKTRTLLNKMLATKSITPDGLKWLTCATDPFHDETIACPGYPDLNSSNVITQALQLTTTVSRPVDLNPDLPWDCHVFFNPVTPPLNFKVPGTGVPNSLFLRRGGLTSLGLVQLEDTGNMLVSGWNIIGCANGQNIIADNVPNSLLDVSLPWTYCSGYFRLVASGCEVVNTTAELYKGGSATVYRSPAAPTALITYGNGVADGFTHTTLANAPPATQTQAALYPTSRTWGASEGSYVVAPLNNTDVPYVTPVPAKAAGLVLSQDVKSLVTGSGNRLIYLPITAGMDDATWTAGMNSPLPFDVAGTIFTGLNPNSTLQVTVKYYLERIPAITEPDLLVLTRPPAFYDPMAIELYSRAISQIPVGCKVSDNPDGEWWSSVLQAIGSVAPIVGGLLTPFTGPLGPLIGTAIGSASSAAAQTVKRDAKRTQTTQPHNPSNNKQALVRVNQPKQHQPKQVQQQQPNRRARKRAARAVNTGFVMSGPSS